jgi:translocation and assembly module TamA
MLQKNARHRLFVIAACCALTLFLKPLIVCTRAAEPVEVVVEGIQGETLANAQASLAFPPGLIKDGRVDSLWLERFERQVPALIRDALVPFGYYEPGISVTREAKERDAIILRVKVAPGEPVRITSVNLKAEGPGAREEGIANLVSGWPLKQGEILRQDIYEKSKSDIVTRAVSLGYLDAQFTAHEVRVSVAKRSAEIDLMLQTGLQYHFGEVRFADGSGYPETFLQRYLTFSKGEVFSYAKLSQTQLNLATSDRFSQVLVTPQKEAATENMVPVEIRLTPSPPKRFKAGVGYATDTGFRGTLLYDNLNVGSFGHIFEADLTVSEILQGVAAQYILPGAHDPSGFTALNAQAKREDTSTYTIRTLSLELSHTRNIELGEDGSPKGLIAPTPRKMAPTLERGGFLTAYVKLQKEHSDAGDETTNPFLLLPGLRLFGRDYDNLTRAEKGFRYSSEVRGTSQVLGSGADFLQFLGELEFIRPLPWRCKFVTRFQIGLTGTNKAAEDLPISVRFFTGGQTSVRGYSYNSLGPTDSTGSVVGGKNLLVGSIEVERAIGKDWGVALFYDVGNAFNNFSNIDAQQGVGFGGRYYTVIGPIKLDIARQVNVPKPDWKVYFAVGLEL